MGLIGSSHALGVVRTTGDGQKVTASPVPRGKLRLDGLVPGIQLTIRPMPAESPLLLTGFVPGVAVQVVTAIDVPVGGIDLVGLAPTIDVGPAGLVLDSHFWDLLADETTTITDWTERWDSLDAGGSRWRIEDADEAGIRGWNLLHPSFSDGILGAITWDDHDTKKDVEIVAAIGRRGSSTSDYCGILVRGSGTGSANAKGYLGIVDGVTTCRIFEVTNGSRTEIGSATISDTSESLFSQGAVFIRFRVTGSSLKLRVWRVGRDEPSAWDIDITDTTHADGGWVGLVDDDQEIACGGFFLATKIGGLGGGEDAESFERFTQKEDFGGLATGSTNPPVGFTWLNDSVGTTSEVFDDEGAIGGKFLRIRSSTANENRLLIPDAAVVAHAPTQEVLMKLRAGTLANDPGGSAMFCVENGSSNFKCKVSQPDNAQFWWRMLDRTQKTAEGNSHLALDASDNGWPGEDWNANTWYWLRARFRPQASGNGGRFEIRMWEDGFLEPDGYAGGTTREDMFSGKFGIASCHNNTSDLDVDFLSFRASHPDDSLFRAPGSGPLGPRVADGKYGCRPFGLAAY